MGDGGVVSLLLLSACLERVTGQPVPLDPRFYAAGEAAHGGGNSLGEPWADHEGSAVEVLVLVNSELGADVQFDVAVADTSAAGGVKRIGTLTTSPGTEVALRVPPDVTTFVVEAFQDEAADGPDDADPYGVVEVDMAKLEGGRVELALVAGGRAAAQAAGGHGPQKSIAAPWLGFAGPTVPFRGLVRADGDGEVQVDVNVPDPSAPGGVQRAGQIRMATPGPFEFNVPTEVRVFTVEAFQDPDNDGPSEQDPFAAARIDTATIGGAVLFELEPGGRAKAGALTGPSGPGGEVPWSGVEGPRRAVALEVTSTVTGPVVLDVAEFDATAPGGNRRVGRDTLPAAGSHTLSVPEAVTSFRVEAFIDLGNDGPSEQDPYAEATVEPATLQGPVRLELVVGNRGRPSGGGAQAPQAAGPDLGPGPKVRVGGAIRASDPSKVKIDVFRVDSAARGGREFVLKVEPRGEAWSVELPVDYGKIEIDAYVDVAGDGPSGSDPHVLKDDIRVGSAPVTGVDLVFP